MKLLLLALFFITTASCAHAQSIKMKIANVTSPAGEDLVAFQVSDTTFTAAAGGGGGTGKTTFDFLKIKKLQDSSTIELWKRSVSGFIGPEITFEFYSATNILYFKIIIRDVTVNHFSYLMPECQGCSKMY